MLYAYPPPLLKYATHFRTTDTTLSALRLGAALAGNLRRKESYF